MVTRRIIEAIEKSGIKQKVIAERIGVSEQTFCAMMKGQRRITAEEFLSICNVLGVTPNDLCGFSAAAAV